MSEYTWLLATIFALSYVLPTWLTIAELVLVAVFSFVWAGSGMRTRQKIQIASWSAPSEGNIHVKLELDASHVVAWMDDQRSKGNAVTITHVIGKALGEALTIAPSLNGRLLFNRFVPYPTHDVSFLVAVEGGNNLAKVKITDAYTKTVKDIGDEVRAAASLVRSGKDENFNKSMSPIKLLPPWLVRVMAFGGSFICATLGIAIPTLGLEAFPFGAVCITSVGMFGIDEAYAPFTPWMQVPVLVLAGALHDGVVVEDGEMQVRKKINLMCTIDHRFIDGAQSKSMMTLIKRMFKNPSLFMERSVALNDKQ